MHKDENKKNKWDQCTKWEIEKFNQLLHSLTKLRKKEGDDK